MGTHIQADRQARDQGSHDFDMHALGTTRPLERRMLAAALVVLATGSLLALAAATGAGPWEDLRLERNVEWLSSMTAALSAVVGVMCLMRWRLVGEPAAAWVGVALLIYAGATVAFPDFVLSLVEDDADRHSLIALIRPAGTLVVIVLLSVAFFLPARRQHLRLGPLTIGSLVAVVVGAVLLRDAPGLATALGRPTLGVQLRDGEMLAQSSLAVVWLSLGAAYIVRGLRRERALHTWLGLMLLGFAEACLALSLDVADSVSLTLNYGIRSLALVFGLYGVARELQHGFVEQRAQLIKSLLDLETAETRLRAEHAAGEERAHDLRSALMAIGGAAHTLEAYYETLDATTRGSLARALSTEITRIQKLITPVHLEESMFDVAEMLGPLIDVQRAQYGQPIYLEVPPGVLAFGRPAHTAEVVLNLLDNACRYASAAPIRIRAERERGSIVIRVEDRGSGVPVSEQQLIFERGWRGSRASGVEGSGLGLYVAARLMREQGGSLWVENRRGGGASFALRLPMKPADAAEPGTVARRHLALGGT